MKSGRNNLVATLSWDDVARRLKDGAAAIVPVGAGSKQHGLHLPMGTDQVQAEYFAARLAERIDALIWPTLLYGSYPAFVAYAGSISLSDGTFEALVREIAEGLLGHRAGKIFFLNAGLSTRRPIEAAM
jgi:creatinine amidohydrolase